MCPIPALLNHPQIIINPPPNFTVGAKHCGCYVSLGLHLTMFLCVSGVPLVSQASTVSTRTCVMWDIVWTEENVLWVWPVYLGAPAVCVLWVSLASAARRFMCPAIRPRAIIVEPASRWQTQLIYATACQVSSLGEEMEICFDNKTYKPIGHIKYMHYADITAWTTHVHTVRSGTYPDLAHL